VDGFGRFGFNRNHGCVSCLTGVQYFSVGSCNALEVLSFNENEIEDLPNSLYQLDQLRLFGMDDNPLSALPQEVTEGGSQEVFNFLGERLKHEEH